MNDLKTVVSVDPGSPAEKAGILPGDVVRNIQGKPFNHKSSGELTNGYRRFLSETMSLRDQNTRYTDAKGFENCMFWDVAKYPAVAKAIGNNRRYKSAFSYLFGFNQYIDWDTPKVINVDVIRRGKRISFAVTPQLLTVAYSC